MAEADVKVTETLTTTTSAAADAGAERAPNRTAESVVKLGRRKSDWHVVASNGISIFFWLFGWLLDDRHKPSMSRILLAIWTYAGVRMIWHELNLSTGQLPLSNGIMEMWWAAEGMLSFAVFGPTIASYFSAGAAGAVAGIGASIRDDIGKVTEYINSRKGAKDASKAGE